MAKSWTIVEIFVCFLSIPHNYKRCGKFTDKQWPVIMIILQEVGLKRVWQCQKGTLAESVVDGSSLEITSDGDFLIDYEDPLNDRRAVLELRQVFAYFLRETRTSNARMPLVPGVWQILAYNYDILEANQPLRCTYSRDIWHEIKSSGESGSHNGSSDLEIGFIVTDINFNLRIFFVDIRTSRTPTWRLFRSSSIEMPNHLQYNRLCRTLGLLMIKSFEWLLSTLRITHPPKTAYRTY